MFIEKIYKLKKPIKEVWQISWPLIIANSFWNIQLTIDRIFLSHYSTETLAATIAVSGLFWAPMALLQQTAAYVTTFVAQYFGAKQDSMIASSLWQSIYISLVGGLLFLLLIPAAPTLVEWMGHSQKLQILESRYFQSLAFSALPTALVAACSGFFTGLGKSKVIIIINGVGLIFNVLFDYLLIFGNLGAPSMGIVGAGLATAIANYCAAIVGFYLLYISAEAIQFNFLKSWKFNLVLFKKFIKYGLPSGFQWALEGMAFTFFLIFIGRMPNGEVALAASSITVTILMLAILPSMGVAQGAASLMSRFLGDKKPESAELFIWSGLIISTFYIFILSLSFQLFPDLYINLFESPDHRLIWQEVLKIVPTLLIYVSIFIFFDSANLIFSFALKGAGDTKFVSFVALLLPWPFMVLPTWYFINWADGVFWAWRAASLFIILQGLVFFYRFKKGQWKTMSII
jgi:multidrug resistance protein, MATE family